MRSEVVTNNTIVPSVIWLQVVVSCKFTDVSEECTASVFKSNSKQHKKGANRNILATCFFVLL
jgi:hypothetical protein